MISKAKGNKYYSIAIMTLCSTISLTAHDCNDAYGSMIPLVKCLNVDRFGVLLTVSCCFKIMHLQIGKRVFLNTDFTQAIPISLRDVSFIPWLKEEQKICLWTVAKSKSFQISSLSYSPICDILWSHLQTDVIEL